MTEWISVKERLPENDEEVLVYNYRDGINIGDFEKSNVLGYYEENGEYCISNSGWSTQYDWAPHMDPSHWMKLPNPPEEKGSIKAL